MEYETPQQKRRDFFIGFFGYLAAMVLLTACYGGVGYFLTEQGGDLSSDMQTVVGGIMTVLGCLPFLLTVSALIYFAFKRKFIALGILAFLALSFMLVIIAGIVFTIACFVGLSQAQV